MMTAIERAEALLEAATAESPECTCTDPGTMHESECPWVKWLYAQPEAERQLVADGPDLLRGYIGAVKALVGRCWHQELYEERSDGASDIYPEIMHEGKCGDETACKICSACQATSDFERLFPEAPASAD